MAWALPGAVLFMVYWLLSDMNPVRSSNVDDVPLGNVTIEMTLSSIQQGHSLSAFALAVGVFAVFALGMLLASISLWTGRQAMRLGATDLTLLTAIIGSSIYLCGILMMLIKAFIG